MPRAGRGFNGPAGTSVPIRSCRGMTVFKQSAIFALAVFAVVGLAHAQPRPRQDPRPTPPHAWLFGAWTGGLFPVLPDQVAEDCRVDQTVVFAQDVVAHGSLTGSGMTRRVIETVRTSSRGADFRFTPMAGVPGFGCPDADGLAVTRDSPNSISFPGCKAFPYRLERCQVR